MNAATRGVILAVVGVALGVLILGQGSDDTGAFATAVQDSSDSEDPPATEAAEETEPATEDDTVPDDEATVDEPDDGTTDETPTEEPATVEPDDTGPPDILHNSADVRVLVVNGNGVAGAAGTVNNALIADGYNGLSPTNTDPPEAAAETSVYYVEGFKLDATALAVALNYPPTSVAPLPADVPVPELSEAHVVIILGADLVPTG